MNTFSRANPARHAASDPTRRAALVAGVLYLITFASSIPAVFLLARWRVVMLGVCVFALAVALVAGERHAARAGVAGRAAWRQAAWIDRAVGPDARVVALWGTTRADLDYSRITRVWADEFFNRSVRDVASADGPLPDGLPVEKLKIRSNGCLVAAFPWTPQYAVVEAESPLAAAVVRFSPSKRAILYRLDASASDRSCFAQLQHR